MLTANEIYEEYAKCLIEPAYVIETYFKTFDKTNNGYVPFKLFDKQREIVRSLKNHRHNIIAKPRQAGVSTTVAANSAVMLAFADPNNPEAILIVANKQDMAFEFLSKIKDFLNQIPRWAWGPDYYGSPEKERKTIFSAESKKEIKLPNGCRVKAVATSPDALRGYTPTLLIMDEAAFIEDGKELFGAAQTALGTGGKSVLISCVTDDTFIYTDNGLRQVGDFINVNEPDDPMHGYVVNKYGVLGNGGVRYSDLFVNNGLQDTVKITTKYNFLEGTKPHKLWSYNKSTDKYDWHTLDSLSIDDFVLIKYGGMVFGNFDTIDLDYSFSKKEKQPRIIYDKVTEDLAYLIGLYIAEGSTYKKYNDEGKHIGTNITITCGDDISSAIDKCGFNYSCHDGLHYTISSKYLGAILEHLEVDLSLKSNDKFFSKRLLSLSKKNTMALIRGYMDGDGYSDSVRGRIGVNTSSKKLCLQLKHMLMNFGILTDYSEGVCGPTDRVKVSSNYYRISATSENAKKYYDLIGFSFERKQIKKCALKDKSKNHHYNLVPNGKKILRRIIDDNGLTYSFRGSGLKVNRLFIEKGKSADISKPIFVSFIDQIKKLGVDIEPYDIDRIIIENSIWCRIKNIELGKAKTYDFSLPENPDDFWCHSVLYNGMLGHQTPNGLDELYYETYDLALKKLNDFNIIEMRWYQDDRYNVGLKWYRYTDKEKKNKEVIDEEDFTFDSYRKKIADGYKPTSPWYEAMCRGMNNDARLIAQELDVSFLGSGGNVVSDEYIEHHRNRNVQDPKYVSGSESELWVWEEPIEGHEYILASDVSRGDGADYSTFTIIDFTTMTQVAEYMGRTPPDKLSNLLFEYGTLYNALVVVDITGGMGVATVLKLQDMKYPNLYYGEKGGQGLKKRKDMDKYNSDNEIAGFQVGSDRTRLVSTFEKMIRINKDEGDDHGIKIRSTRLLSELNSFVYINGRADHTKGKHDDLIMAMAMALFILENSFKQLKAIEQKTRAMLASWVSFSTSGELKVADVNNVNKNKNKPNFSPTVAKNMQDPKGEYMWLFGGFR